MILLLVIAVHLVGCDAPASKPRRDGGTDEPSCIAGQLFDLRGTFAFLITLNAHVDVLGLALADPNPQAEMLLRADIAADSGVVMTTAVCLLVFPPMQFESQPKPLQFIAEAPLTDSLHPADVPVLVSGERTCAGYASQSPIEILLGARLSDPEHDALPLKLDGQGCDGDPAVLCAVTSAVGCICDQEGDGAPGATLGVENAPILPDLDQISISGRLTMGLKGEVTSSDLLRGTADPVLEFAILGCHRRSGACDASATAAIRSLSPRITQDPDYPSPFVAKRIDPSWDCPRLLRERSSLFPR
jgi:hypothetical protein